MNPQVIKVLTERLPKSFVKTGPSSFMLRNPGKIVFVKVNSDSVLIVNDGGEFQSGMDMVRILKAEDAAHQAELDEQIVQDIVSLA